jgi:Tetratricopeptide repeat
MGFFAQLTNLFSRSGREDNRLRQGMQYAEAKRPAQAIAIYDSLVTSKGTSPTARARALFNRALAHSSMKDDTKAIVDLEQVVTMPGAPENVLAAARNQIVRVRNRIQRVHAHAEG